MYQTTVILHLVAMAVWMVPMIGVPLALARTGAGGPSAALLARLRRAMRAVAMPGLVLTWALGIAVAVQGGWFASGWLSAKLVLVLALSGLHGALSARLRRLEPGRPVPGFLRALPWIVLALLAGAVFLGLRKPF